MLVVLIGHLAVTKVLISIERFRLFILKMRYNKKVICLMTVLILLSFISSCSEMKRSITENEIREKLEDKFHRELPERHGNFVIKTASYNDRTISVYCIFEENGNQYDYKEIKKILKDAMMKSIIENSDDEIKKFIIEYGIKYRYIIKGDESNKTVEVFLTPREIEDATNLR